MLKPITKLVAGLLVASLCSSLAAADTTGTTVAGYTFGSDIQGKHQAPPLRWLCGATDLPHACRCMADQHPRPPSPTRPLVLLVLHHRWSRSAWIQCMPQTLRNALHELPAAACARYRHSCQTASVAIPRRFPP